MGDGGVSAVVPEGAVDAKVGTAKKKATDEAGNGFSLQTLLLLVASFLLVFSAAAVWYPRHILPLTSREGEGHVHKNNHNPILDIEVEDDAGGCDNKCAPATCRGFKDLAEMQKAVLKIKCEPLYSLIVTSSSLGASLEKNWLPESVYVQASITLDRLDLTDIAADAFEGPHLSDVSNVVLSNLPNLNHLRRQIFRPFGNLEGIRLENLHGLSDVDNGIVSGLASKRFNDLQFTSDTTSIAELIPSFTGHGNVVPHLVKVIYAGDIGTLRFGHLEALRLDAVTMLVLTQAGITDVEDGTLVRDASGVQQMVLKLNKLKTLSREAVDIGKFPRHSVFLENNPWDCTCELAWLLEVTDHISDDPKCESPAALKGKGIKELKRDDFCGTTATPSPPEETTTDYATTPPATPGPPTPCVPVIGVDRPDGFRTDRILAETPDGNVLVSVPDMYGDEILEWSGNDGNCFQVDVGRRRVFEVSSGLRHSASYTFCFLEGGVVVIGRCFPITLSPAEDDRTWLTNGVKIYVIVGAVLAGVVALLCPGFLIVAALRRWPWLIGKKVLVVEWRRTEDRRLLSYHELRVWRRLVDVFRRCGGDDDEEFVTPPSSPNNSAKASTVSTGISDWNPSRTFQVLRPRGVSTTSGI